MMANFDFDVFISHAFEDKADFVTPLAVALRKYGLKVWYDDFELKVGDSLRDSIESGLARSRYGVVVFSPKFLSKKKRWTKAELNALFQKEANGRKVILPILHKLSPKRMNSVLPIQADKKALRSAYGVDATARSLIEAIRPQLLDLEIKRASAFEAAEAFVAEAQRKYPGYDFAIQSGPLATARLVDTPFAITNAKRSIQISVSDASIIGAPPGGRVQFFGDGVKKAIDFERTGKAQKWEPGEFRLIDWNMPLMPSNVEGSTLQVGSRNLPNSLVRPMRVEVGSRPPIVFPMMEMRSVRIGTKEAEAILSDKELPLSFRFLFAVGSNSSLDTSRQVDITLSWETIGKSCSECKKLIDAVDALRRGRVLRFIDIRLDKVIFESSARLSGRFDPFAPAFRRAVFVASQIEKEFSVRLRMPEVISEEDGESLFHLDCLMNGRDYGQVNNTTLRLVKAVGELGAAQEAFIKGEMSATFTAAPSNYPGYFPLFGQRISTRDWIRVVEFIPAEPNAYLADYTEAQTGTEFTIEIKAKGPGILRWKEDSPLKNLKI